MTLKTHRGKLVVDTRDPATGKRLRVRVPDAELSPRRAAAFERKVLAGWRPREAAVTKRTSCPTFGDFWPQFMEFQGSPANKRPNRPRTLLELQRVFDLYLHVLAPGRVSDITTQVVDGLAAELAARKLSRATIGNVLGALRRALNVAKRWGYISEVPQIDAAKPKHQNAIDPEHWLTREEAAKLVEHCSPTFQWVVLFAIRTGLRLGELQALRWSDLDFANARVHVRRSWSEVLGQYGPTKSGRARECPLPADAAAALEEYRHDGELVFASDPKRPLNPTSLAKVLRRAAKRAGLGKHVHTHMLRHTYASHCIAAGIPTRVVMAWGGWESETMLARYAHLAPREIEHWAAMLPGAGT